MSPGVDICPRRPLGDKPLRAAAEVHRAAASFGVFEVVDWNNPLPSQCSIFETCCLTFVYATGHRGSPGRIALRPQQNNPYFSANAHPSIGGWLLLECYILFIRPASLGISRPLGSGAEISKVER